MFAFCDAVLEKKQTTQTLKSVQYGLEIILNGVFEYIKKCINHLSQKKKCERAKIYPVKWEGW